MSAGAEVDGVPVEADQFGETQTRLDRDQQQDVVAAAEPRRPIGRGEDGLDLGARQEVHLSFVVALAWYREHALDQRTVHSLPERYDNVATLQAGVMASPPIADRDAAPLLPSQLRAGREVPIGVAHAGVAEVGGERRKLLLDVFLPSRCQSSSVRMAKR
jgi:hypothetical protein